MGILKGLKILDFSTLLPGPFATMMFADMGADVLRVESSTKLDLIKYLPPFDDDVSAAHGHLNRSKKSIALNLKKQQSLSIVKSLITKYDIVIEQFRPGVMERLGLDYETLKEINPKLIYCSLTGYGQTGPYRNRPGHDNNYLALAGVTGYSHRKGVVPVPMGIQVADIAGGSLHAVIGILAAALHREKTREGQFIDVSMTDASFSLNAMYGSGYLVGDDEVKPEEMMLNGGTFYDNYETKDGRYFSVGSLEPRFRSLLCEALEIPELVDLALSEKLEDQLKFKQVVTQTFQTKSFDEWLGIFNEDFEGCVEPVLSFSEACEHPQIKARDMLVEIPKSDGTTQKQIASPIKFSTVKPMYKHIGVKIGENTEEILLEQGFTKQQIEDWIKQGVLS